MPRIIWILWLQGFAAAPYLVKQCLRSWQRHNPGWKIVLLDGNNFSEYVNLDEIIGRNRSTITMQALSNVIRINLLVKFGGVWVDATCFCCRPLDEWIWSHVTSGFFAFEKPGRDRLLASWFLASTPDCHLTKTYCHDVTKFWSRNRFPHQNKRAGQEVIKWLDTFLLKNVHRAGLWVHPLTVKILRLHSYHWFHYLFYRMVTKDERSAEIWRRTPKISADIPHRLRFAGLLQPASAEIKAAIASRQDLLYKLDWRLEKDLVPGSVLDYVLRSE